MSSLDDALPNQRPTRQLVPPSVRSDALDAGWLATQYGLTPDPWQYAVLEGWLGRKADEKWAAPRAGLAVPRQNGKNGVLEMRELFGMIYLGEKFLHTAHEVKTARKAFARLLSFFSNPTVYPELAALVEPNGGVRRTNGQEAILLRNGGSVEFAARSKGSGRGFTVDVLVLDEAQELSEDALAALLPTISAAPTGNPQTIVTGTPPGPNMAGDVFTRWRLGGLEGTDPRLCWQEWALEGSVDLDDRAVWAAANPAIGMGRQSGVNPDAVADERAQMDDDTFARERLGMWRTAATSSVIDPDDWARLADVAGTIVGEPCFAVDMNPARTTTSISVAGRRADNLPQIQVVENRNGDPSWVVPWLVERSKVHRPRAVVLDAYSPAASLVDELKSARVPVTITQTKDMTAAVGRFYDAAVSGQLRHVDQGVLNVSLANARKRYVGTGGAWAWNRARPEADITPLVSATLALWAVSAATVAGRKRKGTRRVVVIG